MKRTGSKRSSVSINTIIKGARTLAPHPWIFAKLLSMQLAKWCYPYGSVKSASGEAGRIHQLSIRITDICNLRCHTCGQWGDNGFLHGKNLQQLRLQEVSGDRYIELLEDIVAHGHKPNVYLWGGEPSMYQDLQDVIAAATKLSLPTSIATNGHRLQNLAEFYVNAPLFLLQVSIDGHDHQTHTSARPAAGSGNSFNDITAGLQAIQRAKREKKSSLPLVASLTVISRENVKYLTDIYHAFSDHVDIFVFYLAWWIDEEHALLHERDFLSRFGFSPQLHRGWLGSWQPDDYPLLSSQLQKLSQLAKKRGPAVTVIPNLSSVAQLQQYYTQHQNTFGFTECISIYQAAEIDSNGNMSPCRDYHDYVVGNVKKHTITELWNSGNYKQFRCSLTSRGLMPACSRCCGLMGY